MTGISDVNAYDSLANAHGGEERWAYGTGFTDALAGVDETIPAEVDAAELARVCLALGDDALVLSQRLTAWCSNCPELEDEVALANIALDLLGQARLLLGRAAQADASLRPASAPAHVPGEDALAYFRGPDAFVNVTLAELDDGGDFGVACLRLLVASVWRRAVLATVREHADPVLAAVGARAVVEIDYHRDYAAGWVVRLGDGTALSHERMQTAVGLLWPKLPELMDAAPAVWDEVSETLTHVLRAATLDAPTPDAPALGGTTPDAPVLSGATPDSPALGWLRGRGGEHTPALADLLEEMQSVARAHPEATW